MSEDERHRSFSARLPVRRVVGWNLLHGHFETEPALCRRTVAERFSTRFSILCRHTGVDRGSGGAWTENALECVESRAREAWTRRMRLNHTTHITMMAHPDRLLGVVLENVV